MYEKYVFNLIISICFATLKQGAALKKNAKYMFLAHDFFLLTQLLLGIYHDVSK